MPLEAGSSASAQVLANPSSLKLFALRSLYGSVGCRADYRLEFAALGRIAATGSEFHTCRCNQRRLLNDSVAINQGDPANNLFLLTRGRARYFFVTPEVAEFSFVGLYLETCSEAWLSCPGLPFISSARNC